MNDPAKSNATAPMRNELGVLRTMPALGRFVHVCVDAQTRRPVAIPQVIRTALERL